MFRILICDDDATIRMFLRAVLESDTLRIDEAADGREGVQSVRSSPPDLLILDFMMPRQDGISALTELRPEFPNLPVLMVSAFLDDVAEAAERMGALCVRKTDFVERADELVARYFPDVAASLN